MIKIKIDENDKGQRLDRFLKKYYKKAPLSMIYKMIRKDVKINGKRGKEDTILSEGDELSIYLPEELEQRLRTERRYDFDNREEPSNIFANTTVNSIKKARKTFKIAYEDEMILVAEKPFGLLTHGDGKEKKNHLANQVIDYMIETKQYNPRLEKTFVPAPANRLDRNTTGLVLFGKKAESLRELNCLLREKEAIEKYYLTIVYGNLQETLHLQSKMEKDQSENKIKVYDMSQEREGKLMETIARPLAHAAKDGHDFTLVEVQLITGRSHQIRAHLADAGYSLIGDVKYGNRMINSYVRQKFDLTTQFLHSNRLVFHESTGCLGYLSGKEIESPLKDRYLRIKEAIFG